MNDENSRNIGLGEDDKIPYMVDSLHSRLRFHGYNLEFPTIIFSERLFGNAQYKEDTVWIGRHFFSTVFSSEDRMSILFHELKHHEAKTKKLFKYKILPNGEVFQLLTDIVFLKKASLAEKELDIKQMKIDTLPEEARKRLLEQIEKPVPILFRYAPSHLSKEEIFCYEAELDACQKGIFQLSKTYKQLLEQRLEQEKQYLQMRIKYEKENGLNGEGEKSEK